MYKSAILKDGTCSFELSPSSNANPQFEYPSTPLQLSFYNSHGLPKRLRIWISPLWREGLGFKIIGELLEFMIGKAIARTWRNICLQAQIDRTRSIFSLVTKPFLGFLIHVNLLPWSSKSINSTLFRKSLNRSILEVSKGLNLKPSF